MDMRDLLIVALLCLVVVLYAQRASTPLPAPDLSALRFIPPPPRPRTRAPTTSPTPSPTPTRDAMSYSVPEGFAVRDAYKQCDGGASKWDLAWAALREQRAHEGDKPTVSDAYSRSGLPLWAQHTPPGDHWTKQAQALLASNRSDTESSELLDDVTVVLALTYGVSSTPFQDLLNGVNSALDRGFKVVIFAPCTVHAKLHLDPTRVTLIHFPGQDVSNYFPLYKRVNSIRRSDLWARQAQDLGWLARSEHASIEGAAPFRLLRPLLLHDAAAMNPHRTKYFVSWESTFPCTVSVTSSSWDSMRKKIDKKFAVVYENYVPDHEVHGFETRSLRAYCGIVHGGFKLIRGGAMGGPVQATLTVTRLYEYALEQTLADGYLGLDENIWTIITMRYPELFNHLFGGSPVNQCLIVS